MSQLFASGGQNIGVSASTSALPMNTQDPLGWLFKTHTHTHTHINQCVGKDVEELEHLYTVGGNIQ